LEDDFVDGFDNERREVMEQSNLEQKAEDTIENAASGRHKEYKSNKRPSGLSYLATGLVGAVIGGLLVASIVPGLVYNKLMPIAKPEGSTGTAQNLVINASDNMNVAAAVAQKVTPSVVRISTVTVERDIFYGKKSYEGVGSGVIIDSRGYILTNAHVVGDHPEKLSVFFKDGQELSGEVLWKDTLLDLAVVKVEATDLPAAEMGDSDSIIVGETAIAIGNPLGMRFERSVTQGIVSGLNRSIMVGQGSVMEDLIQTDAAINPGNSGGPLINSKGQVIGINTVKASAEGLGFAIPINITKPITKKLIEKGEFVPTYMGITPLDIEMLGYYATDIEIKNGIYLYDVMSGTPAAKAGLRKGDIITHLDDIEVNTLVKFKSIVFGKDPGDYVKVTYVRNGSQNSVDIELAVMPEEYR